MLHAMKHVKLLVKIHKSMKFIFIYILFVISSLAEEVNPEGLVLSVIKKDDQTVTWNRIPVDEIDSYGLISDKSEKSRENTLIIVFRKTEILKSGVIGVWYNDFFYKFKCQKNTLKNNESIQYYLEVDEFAVALGILAEI